MIESISAKQLEIKTTIWKPFHNKLNFFFFLKLAISRIYGRMKTCSIDSIYILDIHIMT